MNTRRITLIAALILLIPALVVILLFGLAPERAVDSLQSFVERATPYTLELRKPELSWSPLHFSAELLLLRGADPQSPPLVSVQQLDLSMPLLQLVTGDTQRGRFTASNISYYLDTQGSSEPIDLESLFAPLSRLPAEIAIDSAHLISRSTELWIFPLGNISARRTRAGTIAATAMATVGSRATRLEALADWHAAPGGSHRLDLDATLSDQRVESESDLRLVGSIEARGAELQYSVELNGHYQNVGDFLRALDSDAYPVDGNLDISGTMRGGVDGYTLSIRELTLQTKDSYHFTASGEITQTKAGEASLTLSATGNAEQIQTLVPVPTELSALLMRSELQLAVGGTLRAPLLSSASLLLYGAGDTSLQLTSDTADVSLAQIQELELDRELNASFEFNSRDLEQWLLPADFWPADIASMGATVSGSISGSADDVRLHVSSLRVTHPAYTLTGQGEALWRESRLSAPALDLRLRERAGPGRVDAKGTIADLGAVRGLALTLDLEQLRPTPLLAALAIDSAFPVAEVNGKLLALRAAEPFLARDIDLTVTPVKGMQWQLRGNGQLASGVPEADLEVSLNAATRGAWDELIALPQPPDSASGQIRLRPGYATVLGSVAFGSTDVQAVASTTLANGSITELALDLYAPSLRLGDFARAPTTPVESAAPLQPPTSDDDSLLGWTNELPDYPIHLTLRSDGISGDLSRLEQFSLSIEGSDKRYLLRQFDTRYAGGELIVRGVLDLNSTPASISLAGQGIRIPLAALIEDLGLQEAVTGLLSVRGGLSTHGDNPAEWQRGLQGRLAAAVTQTTVSGPAYDLLMSNLLSWLVRGAGEKSTTFDCSMAQFDLLDGVAQSDSVYIETPRMLATGKARIDLPTSQLDVRLEPRSKTRTFQFPSAVRIVGPLDSPAVKVSPLQATADLSAQALLLLPSLTLKLFGIGADDKVLRPCNPSMQ
jgi:uncharacterized protein involved in outer membrane biogenesis